MLQEIKKFGQDTVKYVPAQIVPAIVGLVAVIIYTRILGPEEYGFYILVYTTTAFVSPIAFGWLIQSNLRYFHKHEVVNKTEQLLSTSVLFFGLSAFIIGLLWYGVVFTFKQFVNSRLAALLFFGPLVLILEAFFILMLTLLRAKFKSGWYTVYMIVRSVSILIISVTILSFTELRAEAIFISTTIVLLVISIIELYRTNKLSKIAFRFFSWSLILQFTKYGMPIALASLANTTILMSDRYILGYFIDAHAVGIYAAGSRISQMAIFLLSQIAMLAAYPVIIKLYEDYGDRLTKKFMHGLFALYFLLLIPSLFGIACLSAELCSIIFSSQFSEANTVLVWTASGAFCYGFATYVNKAFELRERTVVVLYILLACCALNVTLNILMVPMLGIVGAAIANFISFFVFLVSSWFISKRYFIWKIPWQTLYKCVIASSVMFLSIKLVFRFTNCSILLLIIKVIFGSSIYLTSIVLLREPLVIKLISYIRKRKQTVVNEKPYK